MLRIEDLDATRVRPEAVEGPSTTSAGSASTGTRALTSAAAAPYVQRSARIDAERLERLKAGELVYPCTCTRADIARAAAAPHAEDEGPTYPGTCAGRTADDAATGPRGPAVRLAVPGARRDRSPGTTSSRAARDRPVATSAAISWSAGERPGRRTSSPSWHDDAAMGVTQVIRGDDLVPSTPRQILLYRALGWPPPRSATCPLGRRRPTAAGWRSATARSSSPRSEPRASIPGRLVGWLARFVRLDRPRRAVRAERLDRPVPASTGLPRQPWVVSPEAVRTLERGRVPLSAG